METISKVSSKTLELKVGAGPKNGPGPELDTRCIITDSDLIIPGLTHLNSEYLRFLSVLKGPRRNISPDSDQPTITGGSSSAILFDQTRLRKRAHLSRV